MSFAKRRFIFFAALVCAATLPSSSANAADKAKLTDRVSASQSVSFDVFLPLAHRDQLDSLVTAMHDSSSPSYHKWLTAAAFKAQFAPSADSVTAVRKQLEAYGLTTEAVSSQRIHVTGDARAVEQAFATQLKVGTFSNGHNTIAAATPLSLPGTLRTNGAVVAGLSGFIRMQAHSRRIALPQNRYSTAGPYWFTDLKQAYKYPSYKVLTGKGVTIGILMSGDFNPPDMKTYFSHEKIAVPNLSTVNINGGAPYDPEGSTETHLDMQQTGGMAPNAKIVLYNLPSLSDDNIIDGLLTILDQNKADVVSMSFGGAEIFYTPEYNDGEDFTAMLGIYDDIFKQGNALGITFVASSGDQGALPAPPLACFLPAATSACGPMQPSAETPASSPHVTGVGGTNLATTSNPPSLDSKYVSEQAFADPLALDIFYGTPATNNYWGSGGGVSIYYKRPLFQALVNTGSKYRTVPDVSGHMGGCPFGTIGACPASDSAVVVAIGGGLFGVIGTSASAPDFAGLLALKVQYYGGRLGNENPEIYALAALQNLGLPLGVYNDKGIAGDNGLYSAKKGYDYVLGNGTVNGVNFLLAPLMPTAGTPQTPSNP